MSAFFICQADVMITKVKHFISSLCFKYQFLCTRYRPKGKAAAKAASYPPVDLKNHDMVQSIRSKYHVQIQLPCSSSVTMFKFSSSWHAQFQVDVDFFCSLIVIKGPLSIYDWGVIFLGWYSILGGFPYFRYRKIQIPPLVINTERSLSAAFFINSVFPGFSQSSSYVFFVKSFSQFCFLT